MKCLEDKTLLGPTFHRSTDLKAKGGSGWLPHRPSSPTFLLEQEFEPRSVSLQHLVSLPARGFGCKLHQEPWGTRGHPQTPLLPDLPYREPPAPIWMTASEVKCPFSNLHAKWILTTRFYWETDSPFPTPSLRKHIVFFTVVHFAFRGD